MNDHQKLTDPIADNGNTIEPQVDPNTGKIVDHGPACPQEAWTAGERLRTIALIASKGKVPVCANQLDARRVRAMQEALDTIVQIAIQPPEFLEVNRQRIEEAL